MKVQQALSESNDDIFISYILLNKCQKLKKKGFRKTTKMKRFSQDT